MDTLITIYSKIIDDKSEDIDISMMPNSSSYDYECRNTKVASCLVPINKISVNCSIYVSI